MINGIVFHLEKMIRGGGKKIAKRENRPFWKIIRRIHEWKL